MSNSLYRLGVQRLALYRRGACITIIQVSHTDQISGCRNDVTRMLYGTLLSMLHVSLCVKKTYFWQDFVTDFGQTRSYHLESIIIGLIAFSS